MALKSKMLTNKPCRDSRDMMFNAMAKQIQIGMNIFDGKKPNSLKLAARKARAAA